jgi:hypothetical protein
MNTAIILCQALLLEEQWLLARTRATLEREDRSQPTPCATPGPTPRRDRVS